MTEMSPRDRLLALYERIAQLRSFRDAEDAEMTAAERRWSDAVIAELEAAAAELEREQSLEINAEEFAEVLGEMVAYQREAEACALMRDEEGAEKALRHANEMSVLCGLLIGGFTQKEGETDGEEPASGA